MGFRDNIIKIYGVSRIRVFRSSEIKTVVKKDPNVVFGGVGENRKKVSNRFEICFTRKFLRMLILCFNYHSLGTSFGTL